MISGLDVILQIVSSVGTVAKTGSSILELIQQIQAVTNRPEFSPRVFQGTPDVFARWNPIVMQQPFRPKGLYFEPGQPTEFPHLLDDLLAQVKSPTIPTYTTGLLGR